jgi:hypothetical protein
MTLNAPPVEGNTGCFVLVFLIWRKLLAHRFFFFDLSATANFGEIAPDHLRLRDSFLGKRKYFIGRNKFRVRLAPGIVVICLFDR